MLPSPTSPPAPPTSHLNSVVTSLLTASPLTHSVLPTILRLEEALECHIHTSYLHVLEHLSGFQAYTPLPLLPTVSKPHGDPQRVSVHSVHLRCQLGVQKQMEHVPVVMEVWEADRQGQGGGVCNVIRMSRRNHLSPFPTLQERRATHMTGLSENHGGDGKDRH